MANGARGSWRAITAVGAALALLMALVAFLAMDEYMQNQSPERKKRILASPQYGGKSFVNPNGVKTELFTWEMLEVGWEYLTTKRVDPQPTGVIPVTDIDQGAWTNLGEDDFQYAWLGHSSLLVAMEGRLILSDPVFEDRASPISWMGPKRFHPSPVTARSLPPLDAILITHDHYDHLEEPTIRKLAPKTGLFLVPLGVGALLEQWGVPKDKIAEMDWWETRKIGSLTFTTTPAVHYASRGLFDLNQRLWASWAVTGAHKRIFISGDSGYFDGFKQVGRELGPMDVTFLKIGAYNDKGTWRKGHMTPEEAVAEHIDLSGGVMVPHHWATFDLGLHSWHEPMERALAEAGRLGVDMATPRVGQVVRPGEKTEADFWWRRVDGQKDGREEDGKPGN